MERLIIIDGNSLVNRAFYAMPPLFNSEGVNCNAVYGVANILARLFANDRPEYVCVTFDAGRHTFRNDLYKDYKATRKGMPEDLAKQMPILKEMLTTMGIVTVEQKEVEADDLIGSLTHKFDGIKKIVVTGDRDSLQLINADTEVWLTKKGLSEISVMNEQTFLESWGLVPRQIIDLKALMGDASDNIPGVIGIGEKTAINLLKEYGSIDNLYEHLGEIKGKLNERLALGRESCYLSYDLATIRCHIQINLDLDSCKTRFPWGKAVFDFCNKMEFRSITRRTELFSNEHATQEQIACENIALSFSGIDEIIVKNADKKAISLYFDDKIFEFAFDSTANYQLDLLGISPEMVVSKLARFLSDSSVIKLVYSLKKLYKVCFNCGVTLSGSAFDVPLATYLINSNIKVDDPTHMLDFLELTKNSFSAMNFPAWERVREELKAKNLEKLYFELELPLVRVLFEMERNGITIDTRVLSELEPKYRAEIDSLRQKICELAGVDFNVNSPKQLAHVLFEVMGLTPPKGRKISTNVEILEAIKNSHPIINEILRYRTIAKLYNTYIETMRDYIGVDGKIHTSFRQTVAVTGRLSSFDPNLQNIPVRTEEGKELRRMFVASAGCELLSADYSQIELRLLAHYSQDSVLLNAYREGQDIHTITASQIFGVPPELVTDHMRRSAKAVNFGIIYGISPFGLAQTIGISQAQAKQYIDKYFATYPTIKQFLDSSVEQYKKTGKVTTLLGRIRNFESGLTGRDAKFVERAAMNMPLQGSASDIIKLAMLAVDSELKRRNLKAKMILQIHDELIIDTPENEVAEVRAILKDKMENVIKLNVPLVVDISSGKSWFDV